MLQRWCLSRWRGAGGTWHCSQQQTAVGTGAGASVPLEPTTSLPPRRRPPLDREAAGQASLWKAVHTVLLSSPVSTGVCGAGQDHSLTRGPWVGPTRGICPCTRVRSVERPEASPAGRVWPPRRAASARLWPIPRRWFPDTVHF